MKKMIMILTVASLLLFLFLVGCEGEKGPVGIQGEHGQDGGQGQDGEPGISGQGGIPREWKGLWSASSSYNIYDAIQHDGSTYICILAHSSTQEPPHTTYWDLMAQAGSGTDWQGGVVTNQTTFQADTDFWTGTNVDFTGANITGLPNSSWDGGIVNGTTNFMDEVIFEGSTHNIRWDFTNSRLIWEDLIGNDYLKMWNDKIRFYDGNNNDLIEIKASDTNSPSIELRDSERNGELDLSVNNSGDCRLRMDSPSYNSAVYLTAEEEDGGGGRLQLNGPNQSFDFDSNTGRLTLRNSSGNITFEIDAETGNIYYSGEMKKMVSQK
jgi:hypothetical protein